MSPQTPEVAPLLRSCGICKYERVAAAATACPSCGNPQPRPAEEFRFRPGHLLRALAEHALEPMGLLVVALMLFVQVAFLAALGLEFVRRAIANGIFYVVLEVVALLLLATLAKAWWQARKKLYDREHAVMFVVFALLGSLTHGSVNLALYVIEPLSFQFDPGAVALESKELQNELDRERATAGAARSITAVLPSLKLSVGPPDSSGGLIRDKVTDWAVTGMDGVQLTIHERVTTTDTGEISWHSLKVKSAKAQFEIEHEPLDPFGFRDIKLLIAAAAKEQIVDGASLVPIFEWETRRADRRVSEIEDRLKLPLNDRIPFSVFFLQAMTDVLQNSAGFFYFRPATTAARWVALIFALAKYAFMTVFLALVVHHWSKPSRS